jgi:hypothetical protein
VVADEVGFTCYIVSGVPLEGARRIAVHMRDLMDWSVRGFQAAVERALGVPIIPATDNRP